MRNYRGSPWPNRRVENRNDGDRGRGEGEGGVLIKISSSNIGITAEDKKHHPVLQLTLLSFKTGKHWNLFSSISWGCVFFSIFPNAQPALCTFRLELHTERQSSLPLHNPAASICIFMNLILRAKYCTRATRQYIVHRIDL